MAGKELVVPDWLKAKIDTGAVKSDAASLISTVSSVPRISLKSNRFNFIEEGEVIAKVNDAIHVVILGVQPDAGMAKTFYEGAYKPGDSSPPDCSSYDGIRPDSWVNTPQSETCATCPNNKWGSAKSMSGGKAKACRDSKRLMVVNAKHIAEGTVYILNVTVSSLKSLSEFGKELAKSGLPLEAVVTQISMDEDSDFSQLIFSAAGVLNEEQGMLAISKAADKAWESNDFTQPAITDQSTGNVQTAPSTAPPAAAEQPAAAPVAEKQDAPASPKSDGELNDLLNTW